MEVVVVVWVAQVVLLVVVATAAETDYKIWTLTNKKSSN